MGIWCGSEFAGGWFYWDRGGRKAGFDRGLTAGAVRDGLIEDWWVMP
jgi:hypothetical protein